MRKLIFGNIERLLTFLSGMAILYTLINSLLVARSQMLAAEEGIVGVATFVLAFVVQLLTDGGIALAVIIALYSLVDIRTLLSKSRG